MKKLFLILTFIIIYTSLFSQLIPDIHPEPTSTWHRYYENIGQLVDQNGNPANYISYHTQHSGLALYLAQNKVHFSLPVIDTVDTNIYRLDMSFVCGSSEEEIPPCSPNLLSHSITSNKLNFYYDHCPNGILNVSGYESIEYENVFSDIDLHFSSNDAGLKAYIIIPPMENPNDIIFHFDGQDSLGIDTNGWLQMFFGGDEMKFPQATAYQIDGGNNPYPISWLPSWKDLGSGNVGFATGNYNISDALIIRVAGALPGISNTSNNLLWSTYCGTSGLQHGKDVEFETGVSENFYVMMDSWEGKFLSNRGIVNHMGFRDIHLIKFNGNHEIIWETFFGGKESEYGQRMEFSSLKNQLYITGIWENAGITGAKIPNISPNNGVYKSYNRAGITESFIVSFNTQGQATWATYFGGKGNDNVQSLSIDDTEGILYIAGSTTSTETESTCSTKSTNKFPICNSVNSSFFQQISAGNKESFIAAFDISDNSLIYSSFFGGDSDDIIYDIVCSGSSDGSEPVDNNTPETYTPYFYICGKTNTSSIESTFPSPRSALSNGSFPLSNPSQNSYFQTVNTAASNAVRLNGFLAYFEDWDLEWNTFIGGEYEDELAHIEVTPSNHVYVSGRTNSVTSSSSNCSLSSGVQIPLCNSNNISFQESSSANAEDLYLLRFNENHQLMWSTTYGHDDSNEQGLIQGDIELSNFGTILVAGNTQNSNSNTSAINTTLSTSNSFHQPRNFPVNSLYKDGYILMFDNNNQMIWSTYFGGDKDDVPYGLESKNNKLLMVGSSESLSGGLQTSRSFPLKDPGGSLRFFQDVANGGNFPFNGTVTEFNVSIGFLTGVEYVDSEITNEKLSCFPNPTNQDLTLEINSLIDEEIELNIYSINGISYYRSRVLLKEGGNRIFLNVGNFENGLYLIKMNGMYSKNVKETSFLKY